MRYRKGFSWSQVVIFLFTIASPSLGLAADSTANARHRMAISFNEAMNKCLESGCKNIEEMMGFFDESAIFVDEAGKSFLRLADIRRRLLKTTATAGLSDQIEAIDVNGPIITMRLVRRLDLPNKSPTPGWGDIVQVKPHVDVMVMKGGRIVRLICVLPPDEK